MDQLTRLLGLGQDSLLEQLAAAQAPTTQNARRPRSAKGNANSSQPVAQLMPSQLLDLRGYHHSAMDDNLQEGTAGAAGSSGSGGEQLMEVDPRKRRMEINRNSARRTRQRKAAAMEALQTENAELKAALTAANAAQQSAVASMASLLAERDRLMAENAALKTCPCSFALVSIRPV